jgi:hypothetical protein
MRALIPLAITLLIFSTYSTIAYSQSTYRIVVTVKDKAGLPVIDASVRVTTKYGAEDYRDGAWPPLRTNSSGMVVYENVYSVEAIAQIVVAKSGVELANNYYPLTSSTTYITITCQSLDTLTIYAQDSDDKPLHNAQVTLSWEGPDGVTWVLSKTTDEKGEATFQQMSYNTYEVHVTWQRLTVHQNKFNFSETLKKYTAQCRVHDLTVEVYDAVNKSLTDAKVTVTRDEWKNIKYTIKGAAVFSQLAEAEYAVHAQYGTYTSTATVKLSKSQKLNIRFNFTAPTLTYKVAVKALWSDDKPITTAKVTVKNEEGYMLYNGLTDSSGHYIFQLEEGAYTFVVSKANATKMQTATITGETTVTIIIDVSQRISSVQVEVYKEDGTFAYGATIETYKDGRLLYNLTTTTGAATLNLPDGTYTIIAKLQDKKQAKTITVNQDTKLPIVLQTEFNPIMMFSTLLAAIIIITAAAIIVKRKVGKPRLL